MMPFDEYWVLYLQAHRKRSTRLVHYVATIIGLSSSGIGLLMLEPIVVGAGIATSYALAIAAHIVFERNRPMILVNPIWGALADLRMTWLGLTGQLDRESTDRRAANGS